MIKRLGIAVSALAMVGLVLPSVFMVGAASATPSKWETYHDEYGPQVSEDFCGVPGLTVEQQGVADGRFRVTAHGPDGLPYYYDRADFTDTWTNLATGEFVTVLGSYQGGAIRVTDNGDGTVTILIQNTDNTVTYSEDGQVIARDTGVVRFEFLFDHAGTPTDPSDDEFLDFLGVVKETGRNDDWCAALVQAIG